MNEENRKYKDFIKKFLTEQGVDFSGYEKYKAIYLRYRGRCLKMKPSSYQAFLNLCTFESTRHTKYDDKGNLKTDEEVGWKPKEERKYFGVHATKCQASKSYKLNYKAPPKKEDFEHPMEWRAAYQDWSYLKAELADYESVKAITLNKPTSKRKPDLIPLEKTDGKQYRYMFRYPFLIRYALRCLSGEYPPECFPDALIDYKDELQNLLNSQQEVYNQEPVKFSWNTNWNL